MPAPGCRASCHDRFRPARHPVRRRHGPRLRQRGILRRLHDPAPRRPFAVRSHRAGRGVSCPDAERRPAGREPRVRGEHGQGDHPPRQAGVARHPFARCETVLRTKAGEHRFAAPHHAFFIPAGERIAAESTAGAFLRLDIVEAALARTAVGMAGVGRPGAGTLDLRTARRVPLQENGTHWLPVIRSLCESIAAVRRETLRDAPPRGPLMSPPGVVRLSGPTWSDHATSPRTGGPLHARKAQWRSPFARSP